MSTWRWGLILKVAGGIAGLITFLLSLLGAYTGTQAWDEARRVDVRLSAGVNTVDLDDPAPVLHIGIVNSSQRGVTLTRGRLVAYGREIGRVTGVLPDERSGAASLRSLPYTLPGQTSITTGVAVSLDDREGERLVRRIKRRLSEDENALVTLELRFAPGGVERVGVPVEQDDRGVLGLETVERIPWQVFVIVTDGHSEGLILRIGGARPSTPEIAELRLWGLTNGGDLPTATITRPAQSILPVPRRPAKEDYEYALSVGGEVISVGGLSDVCNNERGTRILPIYRCGFGG